MLNDFCYSTYARFETESRAQGAALMGGDHLIGDIYTLEPELQEDRSYRIWLVNRFGAKVAFLAVNEEHRILSLQARGWTLRALLSFVALGQDPIGYWGEVVLLCNDPHYDQEFNAFALNLRELMAQGIRPAVDFTEQAARQIIDSKGTWLPSDRVGSPRIGKDSTLVKTHRSTSEKLIEAGRQKNKGCYATTIIIWVVVAVALIAGVAKLLGLF